MTNWSRLTEIYKQAESWSFTNPKYNTKRFIFIWAY